MGTVICLLIFCALAALIVLFLRRKMLKKIEEASPIMGINLKIRRMTAVKVHKVLVGAPAANDAGDASDALLRESVMANPAGETTEGSVPWSKI
jgi:hypothetical protein